MSLLPNYTHSGAAMFRRVWTSSTAIRGMGMMRSQPCKLSCTNHDHKQVYLRYMLSVLSMEADGIVATTRTEMPTLAMHENASRLMLLERFQTPTPQQDGTMYCGRNGREPKKVRSKFMLYNYCVGLIWSF